MSMPSSSAAPDPSAFVAAMLKLPDTGNKGFEGFVRDCLEELLGQSFRLMKSGHQHGMDGANDAPANGLAIGFEGKKYGSRSDVSVAEVQRKISDAAVNIDALDLWILATTTHITRTDLVKFREVGAERGIQVEVLDPSGREDRPSSLALLAASAPKAVEAHLGDDPAITGYLAAVAGDDDFAADCARVFEPFRRDDVGYASTRIAGARWLKDAFEDDRVAIAQLQCYGGLDAPGTIRVARAGPSAAFEQWWAMRPPLPLAVLGAEGVGKTWSFLAWWQEKMAASPDALPLTIVVPARGLVAPPLMPPHRFLAKLIAQRVPGHDEDFWERRIQLWTRAPAQAPRILLVIDGLNQEVNFTDWQKVIQPLQAGGLEGHVAIALTCRTEYWEDDLKSLANLLPQAWPVTVEDFTETELDEMLARHRVPRSELSEELLKLMAIPRYCQLAIQQREHLQASGDITIERLIYEDWRHRLNLHGSNLAPSSDDFHQFLAQEGSRLRSAIEDGADAELHLTRKDMIEALGSESGAGEPALRTALSEIISGNWVDRVPGSAHRFRLRKDRVPLALALALITDLDQAGAGRADRLAQFMEPLRGTDRGVDILRWAVTASLVRQSASSDTFMLLLRDWFFQQNFGRRDFATLERLIPGAPELFLDFAEQIWLRYNGSLRDENIFITAFADAAKYPGFRAALGERLSRWLGYYWVDANRLRLAERDATVEDAHAATTATLEDRHQRWTAVESDLAPAITTTLQKVEMPERNERDYNGLSARALGILSMLPRQPFLAAIASWAASRAISEAFGPFDAMGWVLRINPVDGEETAAALLGLARQLIDTGDDVGRDVARLLLDGLVSPAATTLRAELPAVERRTWFGRRATVDEAGMVHLPEDANGRTGDEPLERFIALKELAFDPNVTLGSEDQELLIAAANETDASTLFVSAMGQDSADYALLNSLPVLARWAPEALTDLIRRIFASAETRGASDDGDAEDKLVRLAKEIGRYWPLLNAETHEIFARSVAPMLERSLLDRKDSDWLHAQISRLAGKTAAQQIAIFKSDPHGPCFYTDEVAVFAAPMEADYEPIRPLLAGEHRQHWISYLASVDLSEMPPSLANDLVAGFANDSDVTRRLLFLIGRRSNQPPLLQALVNTGWSCAAETEINEAANGSLALIAAARHFPVPDLDTRIDPVAWGARVQDDPGDEDALNHFEAFVLDAIGKQSFPDGFGKQVSWLNANEAMLVLAERRGPALAAALDALLERGAEHAFAFDNFPVMTALRALMMKQPEDGARIWSTLYPHYKESSWTKMDSFESLPFYSDRPEMTRHCEQVLEDANTDHALASVARWATEGGRLGWLLDRMFVWLESQLAGDIARAFNLGRFLDPGPDAESFWQRARAIQTSGWLQETQDKAEESFRRRTAAGHWRDRFMSGNDPDKAFASLTLFLACADDRAITLFERAIAARGFDGLPFEEMAIWHAARRDRDRVEKEATKNLDKRLYFTDICKETHAPWRAKARSLPD